MPTRIFLRLFLLAGLAAPLCAFALGLGPIEVRSALNQNFEADIPLIFSNPAEAVGLTVRIPPQQEFDRIGIDRLEALSQLRFAVQTPPGGPNVVRISSVQPIREPNFRLLLEAVWPRGRLLREYAVQLDPQLYTKRREPPPPPAPVVVVPSVVAAPPPVAAAPALPPAPPVSFEGATPYGPVRAGETLAGIANRLRPSTAIGLREMMSILVAGNPDAFIGGNPNLLRAGATLKVPTPQALGVQGAPPPALASTATVPAPAQLESAPETGTSPTPSPSATPEPASLPSTASVTAPEPASLPSTASVTPPAASLPPLPTPPAASLPPLPTPPAASLPPLPTPPAASPTAPLPTPPAASPTAPLPTPPAASPTAPLPVTPPVIAASSPDSTPLVTPGQLPEIVPKESQPQLPPVSPTPTPPAQPEPVVMQPPAVTAPPPVVKPKPIVPQPVVEESDWWAKPAVWLGIGLLVLAVAAVLLLPLLWRPARPKKTAIAEVESPTEEGIEEFHQAEEIPPMPATRAVVREGRSSRLSPAVAAAAAAIVSAGTTGSKPAPAKSAAQQPPKPIDELLKDIDFGLGDHVAPAPAPAAAGKTPVQNLAPALPDTEPPTASVTRRPSPPTLAKPAPTPEVTPAPAVAATPAPSPRAPSAQAELPSEFRLDGMDFDFGDLDMGSAARTPSAELPALELKQPAPPTPPAPPKATDDLPSLPALDFSFGDFGPDTGTAASATPAPAPAPAPIKAADLRNVIPDDSARSNAAGTRDQDGAPSVLNMADLKFEFSNVADDLSKAAAAEEPLRLDEELQNFGNGTLDLGTLETATLGGGGGNGGADYVETKLDLASAYLDMGDQVGARGLLEEVIREGQASQRQRAEALLRKLG